MPAMKIFDYLKALTQDKEQLDFGVDEVRRGYSPYMINRFISMSEIFVPIVNEANRCHSLPYETHFRFYLHTLPQSKSFFSYIKKKQVRDETHVKAVARYFEVGRTEADMYLGLLTEEELDMILDVFRLGDGTLADL